MSNASPDARLLFANTVVKNSPKGTPDERIEIATKLLRLGTTHARLCVNECNRSLSPAEVEQLRRLRVRLTTLCALLGIGFKVGGDPRGYTIKLLFPKDRSGRRPYNTWGGEDEGYGVPTS